MCPDVFYQTLGISWVVLVHKTTQCYICNGHSSDNPASEQLFLFALPNIFLCACVLKVNDRRPELHTFRCSHQYDIQVCGIQEYII